MVGGENTSLFYYWAWPAIILRGEGNVLSATDTETLNTLGRFTCKSGAWQSQDPGLSTPTNQGPSSAPPKGDPYRRGCFNLCRKRSDKLEVLWSCRVHFSKSAPLTLVGSFPRLMFLFSRSESWSKWLGICMRVVCFPVGLNWGSRSTPGL